VQAGDEAGGIRQRSIPCGLVVERVGGHRILTSDDLARQRRLADLSRSGDEHDSRVTERFDDERADPAGIDDRRLVLDVMRQFGPPRALTRNRSCADLDFALR
jgi:hypothetical protein